MGIKKNKIVALLIAVVMVLGSTAMAFATDTSIESIERGAIQTNETVVNLSKGTIKVKGVTEIIKTSKGKIKGKTIKGLKKGQKVKITTSNGKIYVWMTTTKIIKVKKGKKISVKWKKIKKATKYIVQYQLKSQTRFKIIKKKTNAKLPKGAKNIKIRPYSGKYAGVWSKKKNTK